MKLNVARRHRRQGLTLLELVIVLAILAALAGLLLPLAGTYLEKAHAGAASDNFKEVAKVVQQYEAVTRTYPDSLDSLTESAATVFTSMPGGGAYLTPATLSDDQADALTDAGVLSLMRHDNAASESATFDSTNSSYNVALNADFVTVPAASVASQLGYTTDSAGTAEFAVFGFGHDTTIIGEWMQEAPYHFPEEGNPNATYNRFGLVFDVSEDDDGAAANGDARAVFVGVVSFHEDDVVGPIEPLIEFFAN